LTYWLHALRVEKYPITAQGTSLGTTAHVNDLACHLLGAIDVPKVVGMPVPRTQEQINEMIKMISPERVSTRNVEQAEGVPVPKIMEETTEVIQWCRRSKFKSTSLKNSSTSR